MRDECGAGYSKSQPAEQSQGMVGELSQNHRVAVAQYVRNVHEAPYGDCAVKGQITLIEQFLMRLESKGVSLRALFREQMRCLAVAEALINQTHASAGRHIGVIVSLSATFIPQSKFSECARGLVRVLKSQPDMVLSDWKEPRYMVAAYRAKVRGHIPTSLDLRIAMHAIQLVLSGSSFLPAASRWFSRTAERRTSGQPRVGTQYLFQYTV